MADDNGNGNTGGNSSVFWEIRHGSSVSPRPPTVTTGAGIPARGQVKVATTVQGHDESTLADIGKPDNTGKFRVRLRFREIDLPKLTSAEQTWIQQNAVRIPNLDPKSWFLVINVPAIERKPDVNGNWPEMPWEIHWEW
jgi:hypothetical protein